MYSIYSQTPSFYALSEKEEKEREGEKGSLVSRSVTRSGNCVRRE